MSKGLRETNMTNRTKGLFLFALMIVSIQLPAGIQSCSCTKKHPQEHYCSADFVVLAHVKRMMQHPHHHLGHQVNEWSRAYKIRIKKEFKVTESGRMALSYGRILTPSHGASCGIRLKPGRRYLLTGTIRSGKPWINLCHLVQDWDRLTPIQRKGFRRLYADGCRDDCRVMECHWWMGQCPPTTQACYWTTAMEGSNRDCQALHGVCSRRGGIGSSPCKWSYSRSHRQCDTKMSSIKHVDDPAGSSKRLWTNNLKSL